MKQSRVIFTIFKCVKLSYSCIIPGSAGQTLGKKTRMLTGMVDIVLHLVDLDSTIRTVDIHTSGHYVNADRHSMWSDFDYCSLLEPADKRTQCNLLENTNLNKLDFFVTITNAKTSDFVLPSSIKIN